MKIFTNILTNLQKRNRAACFVLAGLMIAVQIASVTKPAIAAPDSPAQCYIPIGGEGLRLDGNCKTSYTFSNGSQGVTFNLTPPGGDFADDLGNCYIVKTDGSGYEEGDCGDLDRRTLIWEAPNGAALAMASINWLTRLSFRSPVAITDSVGNVEYRTNSDIFGNGTSSFLNDGDDNAWYIYVPVGADKLPLPNPAGKCLGVFAVELKDDGSDMFLKAIQPIRTSDGSECVFGSKDAVQGRTGGIGGSERARMYDIASGAGDNIDEMDGSDDRWRFFTAPFFWANKDSIRAFDSTKADFKPLTGSDLDTKKDDWETISDENAPPETERKAAGWMFYKSTDCSNETLVVQPDKKDAYIMFQDDSIIDIGGSIDGCGFGRNINGDGDGGEAASAGLMGTAYIPTAISLSENAVLTADQVNQADFTETGNPAVDPEEEAVTAEPTCFTAGGFLSWILCPVLTLLDESTQFLERQIQGFLFVDQQQFEVGGPLYQSWSTFRGIATVIIVIIALIMIFSQSMGDGIFDNYSVKKILPRLVIAGIAIQLSWFGLVLLIDIFNVIGDGIASLMLNPFSPTANDVILNANTNLRGLMGDLFRTASAGDFFTGLAAVTIGGVALVGSIITIAIGAAAALFVGFITLIVRNMIIFLGVVLAPIAIAMSVLPGTQKTFKWWWESFEKALMMYPIVMAMLATGKILAVLLLNAAASDADEGIKMTYVLAACVAWYAPFFLLPKALQAGGAALGKITGFAGDKSKGMFDKARGYNDAYKKNKDARGVTNAFNEQRDRTGIRSFRKLTDAKTRGGAYLAGGAVGPGSGFERGNMRVKGAQESAQRRLFNEDTAKAELQIKEDQTASERSFNNASIDSMTQESMVAQGVGHLNQKQARQVMYSRLATLEDGQKVTINGTEFSGSWAVREKAQKAMLDSKMFDNVIDTSTDARFTGRQTSLSHVDETTGVRSGVMSTLASGNESLQKSRNSFVNGNFGDVKNKMPDEINPSAPFDFYTLGADKIPEMDDSRVKLWHKQVKDSISTADADGVANLMRQVNDLAKRGAPKKVTDELREAVRTVSPAMAADIDTVISSKGNKTFDPTTGTVV